MGWLRNAAKSEASKKKRTVKQQASAVEENSKKNATSLPSRVTADRLFAVAQQNRRSNVLRLFRVMNALTDYAVGKKCQAD